MIIIENYLILFSISLAIFSIIFLFLFGKFYSSLCFHNKKLILITASIFLVLYGLINLKLISQNLFFNFFSNAILFIISFLFVLFFYMTEKNKYNVYILYLFIGTLSYLFILLLLILLLKDENVGLWTETFFYGFSMVCIGYYLFREKRLPLKLKVGMLFVFISFFVLSMLEFLPKNILDFKFSYKILYSGIIILIGDVYLLFYKRIFLYEEERKGINISLLDADSLRKAVFETLEEFEKNFQLFCNEISKFSTERNNLFGEYNEDVFRILDLDGSIKYNETEIREKIETTVNFLLEENNKAFNTLGDLVEKGKIISNGVVNLDSVIDGAKKNLDGILKLIDKFKEQKGFMVNKNRELEKISEYVHALSMNASIESTSKWNLMTDFSVVASDLRNLSDLIKDQSSQIDDILESLNKDFSSGFSSTFKVKEFFVEMEKINENIFSSVLNIVNYSNLIYSEAETINEKSLLIKETSENISDTYSRIDEAIKNLNNYFSSIEFKFNSIKGLLEMIIEDFRKMAIGEIPDVS